MAGRDIAVSNLLLVLAMAAFVGVPLARALWNGARPAESNEEKRELAGLPTLPTSLQAWMKFPSAFDAYAHDRFGFRDDLLKGYRWGMTRVFHQSTSDRAFVGRDGWLYFTGDGGLADMQGTSGYTQTELRNAVEQINARGELLAVRGIRYGFVVFPDKHTVYPQFLPPGVYAGFEHRRLNALDGAMARTGHVYYFDATDALRRAAADSPFQLYYKSDTHWNPWGAYLGYHAWTATFGSRLGLRQFDYRFDQFRNPHRSARGDLSKMSGYHPDDPDIYPPSGVGCGSDEPWQVPPAMLQQLGTIASHLRTAECAGQGTALIVHDSYMDSIRQYVTSSFQHSWLVWHYLDDASFGQLVDKLHPDVVLVERVERLMGEFPDTDLDALVRELGVVGEPTTVDDRGDLVIGSNGNRKARSNRRTAGTLERAVRDGDRVEIEGWARMGNSPPAAVIAVAEGKVVGEAPVTLYRQDVASTQHGVELPWSGFRMSLPANVAAEASTGLRLYLVSLDTYEVLALDSKAKILLQQAFR